MRQRFIDIHHLWAKRFKLEALGGKSRKDRLFIQYFQY